MMKELVVEIAGLRAEISSEIYWVCCLMCLVSCVDMPAFLRGKEKWSREYELLVLPTQCAKFYNQFKKDEKWNTWD